VILHLRAAVQQLYAVPPGQFVALRTQLVAEAKAAGDKELATAVGALRRPTVAAWAVNHFVRSHPDELEELRSFAELLREAQRTLDADQLRVLGRERARRVDALTERIAEVSAEDGQSLGPSVADEVRGTLTALIADEDAEASVLTGALVRSLSYSGFGSVDIADVVAWTGDQGGRGRRPALSVVRGGEGEDGATVEADEVAEVDQAGEDRAAERRAEREAARAAEEAEARAVRRAAHRARLTSAVDAARRAVRAADRQVAVLTARQEEVTEGIADLERRLATARERLAKVTRELTEASGIRDRRESEEAAAEEALTALDVEDAPGRGPTA
jgi:hypothetical protein